MQRRLFVLLAVIAFALAGCPSYATMHTATPIEKGKAEIGASMGIGVFRSDYVFGDYLSGSGVFPAPYLPQIDARYGINDNIGVGGSVSTSGYLQADVNIAPINTSNFAFSVNPTASILAVGVVGNTSLNVLFDVIKTDSAVLTLGAKPGGFYGTTFETGGYLPYLGGTAGVRIKINENTSLYPWADAVYLFDTGPNFDSTVLGSFFFGVRAKL